MSARPAGKVNGINEDYIVVRDTWLKAGFPNGLTADLER